MARKATRIRADLLLVQAGLAESREKAQALIMAGMVYSPGRKVLKPGTPVPLDTALEVKGKLPYVGRGGLKLEHALSRFNLDVTDQVVLDVGASTGGFTDCLLQRGASRVFSLDVAHGQLDYRIRQDPRVVVIERVNARYPFTLSTPGANSGDINSSPQHAGIIDLATIDVAFISATKVIPSVAQHVKDGGHLIVLIKPQFEAARSEIGRGGIIKDPKVHSLVLARAVRWVVEAGFRLRNLVPSPILGTSGNREFFFLLENIGPHV